MNLPNKLTVGRIILVPFFVAALLANFPLNNAVAMIIFVMASLTDMFDGKIAGAGRDVVFRILARLSDSGRGRRRAGLDVLSEKKGAEAMIYLQLFLSYLKIGFFGFGGGYAMLSLIQHEVVIAHGWITNEELTDIIAVSQMTPGPISINSATYIGYVVTGSR